MAPNNSMENVPRRMKRVILTIPPICGAETEFCIREREISPIFTFASTIIKIPSVIKPIPPIWISPRITA